MKISINNEKEDEINHNKENNNDNNFIIIEEEEINSKLLNLPDYIIETYIFPYLSWKELFFTVRGTHSYLHEIVKSTWCNVIKEEMCNQLKNLTLLYEKDALTKAYEFKYQYLVNYRNLLSIYSLNADILSIFQLCLNFIDNNNVFKLLATFLGIFGQEHCLNLLFDENIDDENKKNKIKEVILNEEFISDFKTKIDIILDLNSIESDEQIFKELNDDFNNINRENVEEVNDNCRLVYNFLQGILEYQSLKKLVKELKTHLLNLDAKIQTETEQWPKRKKFFETAYKILLYSKTTTYKFKYMDKLYSLYDARSPFNEYKEESYNSMVNLRNEMENKKSEILQKLKNGENASNTQDLINEVNEILLKNVIERRLLLTKKIMLTEKFYDVINDVVSSPEGGIINDGKSIKILDVVIPVDEFLKTLLIVSHAYPDNINIISVLKIFEIKKKLEEVQIEENMNLKNTEEISKNEMLSIEKKSEIILLKKQKENLMNKKKKTEQMLKILKKYMNLKENFLKNKKNFKSIIFLLNKMQKIDKNNIDNNNIEIKDDFTNKIENLLDNENIENINIYITEEEKEEFENFEVNEEILKNIECSLMLKIKGIFQDEKMENNDNINHINEKYDIENMNKNIIDKNEFGVEQYHNNNINENCINVNDKKVHK